MACLVGCVDCDTCLGVADVGDGCVKVESGVGGGEEAGCLRGDEAAVALGVENEVIVGAELVEGEVFAGDAEDEGAGFWGGGRLPVFWSLAKLGSIWMKDTVRARGDRWSHPSSTTPRLALSCHLYEVASRRVRGHSGPSDPVDSQIESGRLLWTRSRWPEHTPPARPDNPCSRFRCTCGYCCNSSRCFSVYVFEPSNSLNVMALL